MTRNIGSGGGLDYIQTSTPPDESDGKTWLDPSGDQPTLYVYDESLADWYAQTPHYADSAPSNRFDGEWWVDTSADPPETHIYDGDSSAWQPIESGSVSRQDTQPSGKGDGHIWLDTSTDPPTAKVYDGDSDAWGGLSTVTELDNHKSNSSAHHSKYSHNVVASGSVTVSANSGALLVNDLSNEVVVFAKPTGGSGGVETRWNDNGSGGNNLYLMEQTGSDLTCDYSVVAV